MRLLRCAAFLAAMGFSLHAQTVTTSLPVGSNPISVGVNPVTNKTYIANGGSGTVTVLDGATNTTSTIAAGVGPQSVAVNPITNKIYVANVKSNNVTVIDGATASTITVPTGAAPKFVALNPNTNQIYVANSGSNSVTVIDGATNNTSTVAVGLSPSAIAINTITNNIYVANSGSNSVTVILSNSFGTLTVAVGAYPISLSVNLYTNLIYVANFNGASLSVIDGVYSSVRTIATGKGPVWVAVNPAVNKVFTANYFDNTMTVLDASSNTTTTVNAGTSPVALAVDTSTDIAYVANSGTTTLTAYNDVTGASTTLTVGSVPIAIAANPVTQKIYAANYVDGSVSVVDGSTYNITNVSTGISAGLSVFNPVTSKLYIVTEAPAVAVFDADFNLNATISLPSYAMAIAVNHVTNKIYVSCGASFVVIDGNANTASVLSVYDSGPIAVNEVTNKIYTVGGPYITVVDGATNASFAVYGMSITNAPGEGVGLNVIALNPVTNKIYASNMFTTRVGEPLLCLDGATNKVTAVGGYFYGPNAIAVNPITNKIYVSDNFLRVVDVATNTVTELGVYGSSLAINSSTNKIYLSGDVGVFAVDGDTNQITTLSPTLNSLYFGPILVNPVTNKIYTEELTPNNNPNLVNYLVFDGATNAMTRVPASLQTKGALMLNPTNNQVYSIGDNSIQVIAEAESHYLPVGTYITPLPNNTTSNTTPTLTSATSEASPFGSNLPQIDQSVSQVDTQQLGWTPDSYAGSFYRSATLPPLMPGLHTLYTYGGDGQQGTSTQSGSLVAGSIAGYSFAVAPAVSTLLPQTINFVQLPSVLDDTFTIPVRTVALSATALTPVTFTGQASGAVCQVSGNTLIINGFAGLCKVLASAAPSDVYQAAYSEQTITMVAPQTLTFPTIPPQQAGTSITLTATPSLYGTTTFASTTPTVCAVSGTTATFLIAGTCTIVVSAPIAKGVSQNITVTSAVPTQTVSSASFVTGQNLRALRNNYSGYVGFQFTTTQAITVTAVGRYVVGGNSGTHTLQLLQQQSSGLPTLVIYASVSLSGASPGQFQYAQAASSVTLQANTTYYLMSQETDGGDFWFDTSPITTTGVANVLAPVYTYGAGQYYSVPGLAGQSYVPLSFLYTTASNAVAPLGVTITSPTAGAGYPLGTQVSVAVTTTGNPSSLQLQVDGVNAGAAVQASPLTLNTSQLATGQHALTVIATDGVNQLTSAGVNISINAVATPATNFISAQTASSLRNNYSGFVGMAIKVGDSPLTITGLGRFVASGNSGVHTLKLVQSSGTDVPGGGVSLSLSNSAPGQYFYAALAASVTLQADTTYYLVSQEAAGADFWYDLEPVTSTSAAQVLGAVYTDAQGLYYVVSALPGYCYGPLNFQYQ